MASGSRMSERVDQVFEMSDGTMRRLARPVVWLVACGLPAMCLAATVVPGASGAAPSRDTGLTTAQAPDSVRTQAQAGKLTYDAVSIKPCAGLPAPGTGRGQNPRFPLVSPGYAAWGCVTLAEIANQAYVGDDHPLLNRVNPRNPGSDDPKVVRGGPAWVYSDRFAIEAKAVDGADRKTLTGPMLQAMLEDRFQLKLRRTSEDVPMYALAVAKTGLKLTPTPPGDCWVQTPAGRGRGARPPGFEEKPACGNLHGSYPDGNVRLEYTGITLKGLAASLSGQMDRYVVDTTGVDGMFNFPLEYAPDDHAHGIGPPSAPSPDPARGLSIFKALEALGLSLQPTKGPSEYLVIDRVQKPRQNSPAASMTAPVFTKPSSRTGDPGGAR
jgi:uncharacterized protein (TIGR03435 family)